MKIKISSKLESKLQIVFFSDKKIVINSSIKPDWDLNWIESILEKQVDEKTNFFPLFHKDKKILFYSLKKFKHEKDFLKLGGRIGKVLLEEREDSVDLILPKVDYFADKSFISSLLEGIFLGNYKFNKYKTKKKQKQVKTLQIITEDKIEEMIRKADITSASCNLARDCANTPGNHFFPATFVEQAQTIAKEADLRFSYLDKKAMAKEKMDCILSVSQGSAKDPYLVILEYLAPVKQAETLLLVGKGLTFDCGGISIKPSANMDEMKFDMCGGAAVLGAMRAIGLLRPNINVIGMIPTSENLVNGQALKPGDVITACNGKTIEVLNTDAEGRLILADALAYGVEKYKPKAVVDVATLTGACVVALGKHNTGLMSDEDKFAKMIIRCGEKTGEGVWRLPVQDEYQKQIEGDIGDLKNIGGKEAGTITAGMFLKNFVKDTTWAHLDIAGTAWNVKSDFQPKKGATGVGVRLLTELALSW